MFIFQAAVHQGCGPDRRKRHLAACAKADKRPSGSHRTAAAADSTLKDELGDPVNTFRNHSHNNYYEFSANKEYVAVLAENSRPHPGM
jgi:hypothetical protein